MKNKKKLDIGVIIIILSLVMVISLVIYSFTCVSGWENVDVVNMGSTDVCGEMGADKLGFWGAVGFSIFILIIMLIGAGISYKSEVKNSK